MKKIIALIFITLASYQNVDAQMSKPRGTYLNFNYVSSTLKGDGGGGSIESNYGAALTIGHTYYLHKEPILDMIRFGLDLTYFDLNVAEYSHKVYDDHGDHSKVKLYQAEAGMHFGPSITISPTRGLNISGYFRYAPSFSGIYDDDDEKFSGAYGTFFVAGASLSYNVISVGVENRWGSAKYKFDGEEDENGESQSYKQKRKTTGPRVYLGFRF